MNTGVRAPKAGLTKDVIDKVGKIMEMHNFYFN
jgi:hypothetical protein